MEFSDKPSSRKKFLKWGALLLGSASGFRLFGQKKEAKSEKVKMLTADGRLVEVDKDILTKAKAKKVSNQDIYDWMKNPSK